MSSLEVEAAAIKTWFGEAGKGTQFKLLGEAHVMSLLESGQLREIYRGLMVDTSNKLKLIRALQVAGIRPGAYSVLGAADQALCLESVDGEWEVFFFERGGKTFSKRFFSEADACTFMYPELMGDKPAFM